MLQNSHGCGLLIVGLSGSSRAAFVYVVSAVLRTYELNADEALLLTKIPILARWGLDG